MVLYSLSYGVEAEAVNTSDESFVNEKFKFIQDIYSESWALIIGINRYENVEPLTYAVDDAEAVRLMLMDNYGFKNENIILITDEEATKENILDGFSDILQQAGEKDRVVVFYAGHGETYKLPSGGDMGYLIPVDGNVDNLYRSSIPMKSVYDIAEMSYAKHILYLVDAYNTAQAVSDASSAKNQALYGIVGSGVSAVAIWLWNVRDMKKYNSDQASTTSPMTFGINQSGQVQLTLLLN